VGEGGGQRLEVGVVAAAGRALGQVASEPCRQPPPGLCRLGARLRETPPAGELAQQLEQPQVGARGGLALVDRRLDDGHRAGGDRRAEDGLQRDEGRLALGDPAQVVLIEVEEDGRDPVTMPELSGRGAPARPARTGRRRRGGSG
jgi:hypothetical protein